MLLDKKHACSLNLFELQSTPLTHQEEMFMPAPRNVRVLAWFNFWVYFRPYAPIAIIYFSQVSGSYALGISVFSIAMLSQAFFEVPTGVFSDRIGRKNTVVCGAICTLLSLALYALGGAYWALLIGGVFEGIGRAFYSGNNEALLYDTLVEHGRIDSYQEFLGKTTSTFQLALAISAVVGGVIAAISFQIVMWVSVVPMVLALLTSLQFVEPRVHSHQSTSFHVHLRTAFQKIIQNPRLRTLSAASILSYAIGESAWVLRSAFVETLWPIWALGVAQMLGNAAAAVGFYFAGRIIKGFGEYRLLIGGMSISEATNLFGLLVPTVLSPALMALNSVFYGTNNVVIGGLLQREFSDEQRATMGSLNSFGGSVVYAMFSFLLGALADRIGVVSALVVASLLAALPMTLYALALRTQGAARLKIHETEA
jgi:MFS family permease